LGVRCTNRRDPDFVRITGADGHESDGLFSAVEHSLFRAHLLRDHVLERTARVLAVISSGDGVHSGGYRRHDRIRVDLSVRMMQRHADLGSAILERQDVLDIRLCRERLRARAPDFEQQLDARPWRSSPTVS
jgi:hypothetical protein